MKRSCINASSVPKKISGRLVQQYTNNMPCPFFISDTECGVKKWYSCRQWAEEELGEDNREGERRRAEWARVCWGQGGEGGGWGGGEGEGSDARGRGGEGGGGGGEGKVSVQWLWKDLIVFFTSCNTTKLGPARRRCLQGWAVFKMDWRLTKAEVTFMSPAPCSTPGIHWGEPHHLCHADFNSDFFLGETWRSGCVKRTDWTLPPPWFRWAGFQVETQT